MQDGGVRKGMGQWHIASWNEITELLIETGRVREKHTQESGSFYLPLIAKTHTLASKSKFLNWSDKAKLWEYRIIILKESRRP